MATSNRGEKDARFAIAATCFKCEKQIVKTEVYSKDNVHCGAPIAATIERHYATPHGAICLECYHWYVSLWRQHLNAEEWEL
jgi:hypothetical protein